MSDLPTLDALEAFDAMRAFLEAYWEQGSRSSDDLAVLLSSIERDTSIRPDGGTLDPASWDGWLNAIATVKQAKGIDSRAERYEVVRGTGPENAFVELWDRSLAPDGLAFEAVADEEGAVTVTGYQVVVPLTVFEAFLPEARRYLGAAS